jgi:tetratricopeptide (TPR) repeat protein
MGKYQYAIADLIYTLDRFVNHPKALQLMGSLAELTNGPSLAIPYYQRALKLYPQYALTHAQFGVYLVDTGHINSGTAELKKAIEINPNLAIAYAWLASAYSRNGNLESARQAAERARALGYRGKIAGQDLAE